MAPIDDLSGRLSVPNFGSLNGYKKQQSGLNAI